MIRNITRHDATRGTHKAHGRPLYGIWFGFYLEDLGGIPVELSMDHGMLKATDRRDGSTLATFGVASKFYFAPIPLPLIGDELIYTAEGDGQEYQVTAVTVPNHPAHTVGVELDSYEQLSVDASRLRYNLDALHAEALAEDVDRSRAQIEQNHANALSAWTGPVEQSWTRYRLSAMKGCQDIRMHDPVTGAVVAVIHQVSDGYAPQLAPNGERLGSRGAGETFGFAVRRVEVALALEEDADRTRQQELWQMDAQPSGCEGAELEQVRTEVRQQLATELDVTLPGVSTADIPSTCTCTYRPVGDRGPLAQRMRRIEHSGNDTHCPVPGHQGCTCTYRPLDCPVPGHLVAPSEPEPLEDYSPRWMSPLQVRDDRHPELRALIDAYAMAAVRCARWTTSGVGNSNSGYVLGKAAAQLERYLGDMA